MIFYEVGTADNSCYAGLAEPDWHRRYDLPGIPNDTKWKGVLVDLQPSVVLNLLRKYLSNPNLTILNAALDSMVSFVPAESKILMELLELIGRRALQQAQSITIKIRENLASISLFIRSI